MSSEADDIAALCRSHELLTNSNDASLEDLKREICALQEQQQQNHKQQVQQGGGDALLSLSPANIFQLSVSPTSPIAVTTPSSWSDGGNALPADLNAIIHTTVEATLARVQHNYPNYAYTSPNLQGRRTVEVGGGGSPTSRRSTGTESSGGGDRRTPSMSALQQRVVGLELHTTLQDTQLTHMQAALSIVQQKLQISEDKCVLLAQQLSVTRVEAETDQHRLLEIMGKLLDRMSLVEQRSGDQPPPPPTAPYTTSH